jgi:hypothetical protein
LLAAATGRILSPENWKFPFLKGGGQVTPKAIGGARRIPGPLSCCQTKTCNPATALAVH